MKILFLTQWFQPEPFFKALPFAKALRDRGHEIEVLTGFPNYPGGKVYPGYRVRIWQREDMEGIAVNRVALYPSHNKSGFRRTLNYLSFGMNSAISGLFVLKRPEIIYVYNLVTLGLTSWILSKYHRCPVVYDIQDLWPDSVYQSGMMENQFFLNLLSGWCKSVYRRATHVVTLSPGMKTELVTRGVSDDRISVIYNWCEEEHISPDQRDEALAEKVGLLGSFVVMFAGTMGVAQGLDAVLAAAERIVNDYPKIRFAFVGDGVDRERLRNLAIQRRISNVTFIERQPVEMMGKILSLADVLLVHLRDAPLFRITIPSKVQAYLAAGKPILLSVRGDAADIIKASRAGTVAEPENPKAIAEAVLALFHTPEEERFRMSVMGRRFYQQNMSFDVGVSRFEEIFCRLLNGHCVSAI